LSIATDNIKRPRFPKEKDTASPTAANTGRGTVAVVVRKRVVHVVDDSADCCTADEDFGTSKSSTVPKPRPLFKVLPAQLAKSIAVPPATQTSKTATVAADGDSIWPDYACLMVGMTGGIGIRLQKPELAVIIRSAIHKIISWILFKDSFPSLLTRALWNRVALAEASKEFMDCARGPLKERYQVIQRRISLNPIFINRISRLVCSTINTIGYLLYNRVARCPDQSLPWWL